MNKYIASKAEELLRFGYKRATTNLFKRFLDILERQRIEHLDAMEKLRNNLPEEYKKYVVLADYYTESKAQSLRKEVLDAGNDSLKTMDEALKSFDIKYNF
jgi:molybdopterin converting factor small subunit